MTTQRKLGLTTRANRDHMTDEADQLFLGLESSGYYLAGFGCTDPELDCRKLLDKHQPEIVVVQDQREWEGLTGAPGRGKDRQRDLRGLFRCIPALGVAANEKRIVVGTVLKDAQNSPAYHRHSAGMMGASFLIVYYAPDKVRELAPFTKDYEFIRTYHSIDAAAVPAYSSARQGAIISGAISGAYPLRTQLVEAFKVGKLPGVDYLPHPGYGRRGCLTPRYIETLARYRVSICTASKYGFALRKLIESTAAGCAVITNLPKSDPLPEIDGNLHRVPNDASAEQIAELVAKLTREYDSEQQAEFAQRAKARYDYHETGLRLAIEIESLKDNYGS